MARDQQSLEASGPRTDLPAQDTADIIWIDETERRTWFLPEIVQEALANA